MKNYRVVIDYREKDLNYIFKEKFDKFTSSDDSLNKYSYEVSNLLVGDINFYVNDELKVIVERKTIKDLSQSIKDGRYREQKSRILSAGCDKIIYIFEGCNPIGQLAQSKYLISYKTYLGTIVNNFLRDGVYVHQTVDIGDTRDFLLTIMRKLDLISDEKSTNEYIHSVKIKKRDNITGRNCFLSQLCAIPGISYNIAIAIQDKYKSWYDLIITYIGVEEQYRALLLEPIEIKVSNGEKTRKLGKVLSQRIYDNVFSGI